MTWRGFESLEFPIKKLESPGGQLSLRALLEEPDFTTATFLLCAMGEGTFLTLLKFLGEHAPDPVTATLARLAHRDEARHVAFGTEHMRYVFEREPDVRLSMAAAVERRSQMLASISGLSSYVHDAVVVFAGAEFPSRRYGQVRGMWPNCSARWIARGGNACNRWGLSLS